MGTIKAIGVVALLGLVGYGFAQMGIFLGVSWMVTVGFVLIAGPIIFASLRVFGFLLGASSGPDYLVEKMAKIHWSIDSRQNN